MIPDPTADLGELEARAFIKFLFFHGKRAADFHGEMNKALKDGYPSYSRVSGFRTGHFEVTDEPQLNSATTENKADAVHVIVLKDVRFLIHNILYMRKLSTKWLPTYLNAYQKRISNNIKDDFGPVRSGRC
ncbi:uncharacterized protein LOC115220622 [Octopus sinensis]|uniref:Uncharacterized protein LOC115220622 n=1 Tax=Octopus sinensis TaxID=2607531 RepID=A0A6P7T6U1_9MOLL|nr:uncharacterized protein LOC115220622 [Octopus sinensis]